jgi:hypothetical protein
VGVALPRFSQDETERRSILALVMEGRRKAGVMVGSSSRRRIRLSGK